MMANDFNIENEIDSMMVQESEPREVMSLAQPTIEQDIEKEIDQEIKEERFGTTGQKILGLGEAYLRGTISGPAAVALETKVLGIPKEEIRARQEQIGETAETIAETLALLGPGVFGFGAKALGRLGFAAVANAPKATKVLQALNQATYLQAAGNIAARKATSEAAKKAIAFGVEGSLFAAMDPITRQMLSDEPTDVMKTASNVISSATFGAAFGAGTGYAVGKIAPLWRAKFGRQAEKALQPVIGENPPLTTAEAIETLAPESERGFLKKALSEQMPRKKEFMAETFKRGIPVTDAMTSESSMVQRWGGSVIDSPTVPAYLHRIKYDKGFKRVDQIVKQALKSDLPEDLSKAEIGELLFNTIEPKVRETKAVNDALYDAIRKETQFIPVSPDAVADFSKQILNLNRVKDNPRSPSAKFARDLVDDLIDRAAMGDYTVENLNNQIASISERMGKTAGERSFAFELKDLLKDLRDKQVMKFAEEMPVPRSEAEAAIKDLLAQSKLADQTYKEFRDNLSQLAKGLGIKIKGPSDFLLKLSEMKPEQITKKFLAKDNAEFLQFLGRNFPDELKVVMDQQKNQLLQKFSIEDTVRSGQLIKEVLKLPKEVKQVMFTPAQIKDLEISQWWLDRAARLNINPSKTARAIAINDYFTSKAAIMTVGDIAKISLIRAYTGGAQPSATAFKAMTDYFMSANQGALALQNMTKNLFQDREVKIDSSPERNLDFIDNKAKSFLIDPKVIRDDDEELSHYLPEQYQAAKTIETRVLNYINQQRPRPKKSGPLAQEMPPSLMDQIAFKKTLEIANQPQIILKKIQNGTIQSKDIIDLNSMYPELRNEMLSNMLREVANKMNKNEPINFKLRRGLSVFGALPMDGTFTPQAIQMAQSTFQPQGQPQQPGLPQMAKKSSKVSKLPEMADTEIERRLKNR